MILSPLKDSVKSLEDILNQPINEYIRDGVIQRFEYTFELSWKMMKRYFKEIGRTDVVAGPKPVIREAAKEGLIDNVDKWFEFLEARNLSTHTYSENYSLKVYEQAKLFPQYVKQLISQLEMK